MLVHRGLAKHVSILKTSHKKLEGDMEKRKLKIGSLFSGYGGLDLAVEEFTGGQTVWHVEFDQAPSKVLAKNFPGMRNYGDIRNVDWSKVEPIDILTGGFPCQDVSLAGRRAGMQQGTRSGLWSEFANAIEQLRPRLVVIENVRGLLNAKAISDLEYPDEILDEAGGTPILNAIATVCGDLADLGYDAKWGLVPASAAGAPHQRNRIFITAYPSR
jgi:DNA (cytosine-5)-methyltransferase 1